MMLNRRCCGTGLMSPVAPKAQAVWTGGEIPRRPRFLDTQS